MVKSSKQSLCQNLLVDVFRKHSLLLLLSRTGTWHEKRNEHRGEKEHQSDSGNACTDERKNEARLNNMTCQNTFLEEMNSFVHTYMHAEISTYGST